MINNNAHYKDLLKKLESFGYTTGERKSRVFCDLMRYVVYGFCLNAGLPSWNYTKEQTQMFAQMFSDWILAAKQEIDRDGWCDIPGNLHQSFIYTKGSKGFLGQYFTPEHVCSLMTELSGTPEEKRTHTVYDNACGSGRLLLAAFCKACKDHRRIYCVAKDIDEDCVMMTVANFLTHGVVGEVVCGDGLNSSDGRLCFLVNENLNNPASKLFGIPHCRVVSLEETLQGHKESQKN